MGENCVGNEELPDLMASYYSLLRGAIWAFRIVSVGANRLG